MGFRVLVRWHLVWEFSIVVFHPLVSKMLNDGDFIFNDDGDNDGDENDESGGSVPGRSMRDQSLILVPGTDP